MRPLGGGTSCLNRRKPLPGKLLETRMQAAACQNKTTFAWWPLVVLVVLATASTAVYGVVAQLAAKFGHVPVGSEELFLERPLLPLLACFAVAFVLYLAAVSLVKYAPRVPGMLPLIVFSAVVFRVLLTGTTPVQEIDIYRYLWDGAVAARGVSPFKYSPQQVLAARSSDKLPPDLKQLVELRDAPDQAGLRTALERIHFEHVPTVYPLISQVVFAAADLLSPPDASLAVRLTILKALLVAFELGSIGVVLLLLRHAGLPLEWIVIYAWCPLLMKETANGGHLDAIAVFLTATAALLLVYACFPSAAAGAKQQHATPSGGKSTRWWRQVLLATLSAVVLGLAVGAKIYPIVLAPAFVAVCFRPLKAWTIVPAVAGAAVSLAVLFPMAPRHIQSKLNPAVTPAATSPAAVTLAPLPAEHSGTAAADPSTGLKVFLGSWEMNDFLFLIVHENLRPSEFTSAGQSAWFTVTPDSFRTRVAKVWNKQTGASAQGAAFLLTRLLTAAVFLVLACVFAWQGSRETSAIDWLKWVFLTIAWFWLLSPTQNPWYWTWALPFIVFARSRVWLLMAGLVMIYYLRFWLDYHHWDTPLLGSGYKGVAFFDLVVTWLEFGPWLLLLVGSYGVYRWRTLHSSPVYSLVKVVKTQHD